MSGRSFVRHAVLVGVVAIMAVSAVLMVNTLRSNEEADAWAAEAMDAHAAADALENEVVDYLDGLNSVAAFIAAGDHTPESLTQYVQDTGFFAADSGYGEVAVAEVALGAEGLAELGARERLHDPAFEVLGVSPNTDQHYILTRLIGSDDLLPFVGFDLSSSSATASDIAAAVDRGMLSQGAVQLDVTTDEAAELREVYLDSEIQGIEIVFYQPVVVDDDVVAVILAKGVTSPSLERVLEDTEGHAELRLELDGEVVASTPGFVPGGPMTETAVFETGALAWTIQSASFTAADHTQSTQAAWAAAALILGVAVILSLLLRNAETSGQLRESHEAARTDPLTGLRNRLGLSDELERMLERSPAGTVLAVLLCDLDQLKVVNDSMGHGAGDESLQLVARVLEDAVGDAGVVGRFGGDEFVVLSHVTPDQLASLSSDLHTALEEPLTLGDGSQQVLTTSIGIATWADGATSESLLRDADAAMYAAKRAGRATTVVFDANLRAKAVARLSIEQDLRRGLAHGELIPHYQALVAADTGAVVGVEALARWNHPTRSLLGPAEFIAVAEESGLINDLGATMLDQALAQWSEWHRDRSVHTPRMAVNVAQRQIMAPSFVRDVAEMLERHDVDPAFLELEISEDLLMHDVRRCQTTLTGLRDMGVHLAIDDFGTGRASLGQLRSLSMVSTLKIDRTFVRHIDVRPGDREIVRAIVTLARSLDLQIVAEGVEKPAQVDILRTFGVDVLQGFLFSRPAPAPEVQALFAPADPVRSRG